MEILQLFRASLGALVACQILAQTARLPLLWQSEEFPQLINVAQFFNTVEHPQGMVFRAVNFFLAFCFQL